MPKRESRINRLSKDQERLLGQEAKDVGSRLRGYLNAVKGKPKINKREVYERLEEFSGTKNEDFEKARLLAGLLKPLTETLHSGWTQPAEQSESAISVRDAFDLYKELAKIYERNQDYTKAQTNYAMASLIAIKARANETAKTLYDKTRQMEKLSGVRGSGQAYVPTTKEIIEGYTHGRANLKLIGREIKPKGLESNVEVATSIIGIVLGLFFLSSGLSNNIQLSPGISEFNWKLWLGIVLLLIGMIAGLFWMKKR